MRFSMRFPEDVCRSQSTAADASRTIIALRVLLVPVEQYQALLRRAYAYAGDPAILRALAFLRFLEFLLIDSPKATFLQGRRAPSNSGVTRRAHCAIESFLSCSKHTFMCTTCHLVFQPDDQPEVR